VATVGATAGGRRCQFYACLMGRSAAVENRLHPGDIVVALDSASRALRFKKTKLDRFPFGTVQSKVGKMLTIQLAAHSTEADATHSLYLHHQGKHHAFIKSQRSRQ
jgi:hypothetical protein